MGLSRGSASIRVLHVSRGRPLTSAEQEPHLPALQFQRTARSGAWCAWMWWSASSTTISGAMGTWYVTGCPPSRSPRNTSKIASAIASPLFVIPNNLLQVAGQFRHRQLAKRHGASLADDYII